jgi:FMN phosphatase YigB (HAD superfamily)
VALERTRVAAKRALHVGDIYALDVVGARAARLHAA